MYVQQAHRLTTGREKGSLFPYWWPLRCAGTPKMTPFWG